MGFREGIVRTLAALLGVELSVEDDVSDRVETLEQVVVAKVEELDAVKEAVTLLIMTNPNLRVVAATPDVDAMAVSGSSRDGKLLN